MKLVVGLGNPGKKYENTRHNVGFTVIHKLAERHAAGPGKNKFEGELQECLIGDERVLLLMPHTYMNLSGISVRQALDFYKIPQENLLLVCDDFNLPLGKVRLRAHGTDGGQKGLADTIRQLGTNEFSRLRFGIGPVPEQWDPADFVLGKFSKSEQELYAIEVVRTAEAVETWVNQGITQAMNLYNAARS
tara:strand:- start:35 stop:604 length:570 start_codon:yes stop_codon:yes gene_type:complete